MTSGTILLSIGPIVGIALLTGSIVARHDGREVCAANADGITVAAQQAIIGRLPGLHFPVFSYSSGDRAYASNDRCDWTVLGRVEALAEDGTTVRLGWAVNLSVTPGGASAPRAVSEILF